LHSPPHAEGPPSDQQKSAQSTENATHGQFCREQGLPVVESFLEFRPLYPENLGRGDPALGYVVRPGRCGVPEIAGVIQGAQGDRTVLFSLLLSRPVGSGEMRIGAISLARGWQQVRSKNELSFTGLDTARRGGKPRLPSQTFID
jgi:hypothetical protein